MNLPGLEIQQLLQNFQQIGAQLQTGKAVSGTFSGVMKDALKTAATPKGSGSEPGLFAAPIKGTQAPALFRRLKRYLMSKGISLDEVVANDAGLKALKDFLNSTGFNSLKLDTVIHDLKEKSSRHGVRLSELVSRLEEMAEEMEREPETMLELSSLPFLESILSQFITDPQKQQAVWDGVKNEGKGIRLSRLISNLKSLLRESPETGRMVPDESSRSQILKLMDDLGMPADKGVINLERFVHELEGLAARLSPSPEKQRMDVGSLNQFFDNLHPIKPNKGDADRFHLTGKTQTAALQSLKADAPGRNIPESKATLPNGELQKVMESVTENKPLVEVVKTTESQTNVPTPTAPSAPKTPARTLPAYVTHQVGRQILQSHRNGQQEIRLQLKPPFLGRVQMNIDTSGGGIRVNIITEQPAAQEMLLSHANELKTTLMEQGLKLEKIDIQFDQHFDQSMSQQRQESNKMAGRRQRRSGFTMNQDAEDNPDDTVKNITHNEGMLDLVA